MREPESCVVFEPFATLLAVVDVADANMWQEVQYFSRDERRNEEIIYELDDGETVVRGIDDQFVAVVFASVTGPRRVEAEQLLRAAGRAVDDIELWQWARSDDPARRAFALRAVAATSTGSADPRIVSLYTEAVSDGDPVVRAALLESVGRAAWPELWPVVDALASPETAEGTALKDAYEAHLPRPTSA